MSIFPTAPRFLRLAVPVTLAAAASTLLMFGSWRVLADPYLFTNSSDVGWHWLLAGHYGSRPVTGPMASEVLDVMATYPPAAHILAGLLGRVSGGLELRSINAVASLCLTAIHVYAFWRIIRGKGLPAAAAFLVGSLILAQWRVVIGHELIQNFFYAQVVATFVAVFGFSAVVRLAEPFRFYLAALLTFLLGFVFPAMAIIAGAAYGTIELADFHRRRLGLGGLALRAAVLVAMILANPYFWPMITNAAYEGYTTVEIEPWIIASGAACLILLIGWAIHARREETQRPDPLFYLTAGFCITALLQYAASLAGFGGHYVISKYSFGLGTFGLYTLIVVAFPSRPHRRLPIDLALAVLATAALFAFELKRFGFAVRLATLEKADRTIAGLARARPDLDMLYSTAVDIDSLAAGFNFALTKVSLQGGWATGYDALNLSGALPDPSPRPATLVVVSGPAAADCAVASAGPYAVVRRACVKPRP